MSTTVGTGSGGRENLTHWLHGLVLPTVELLAVVEDVVVRGVEAGFDAVPHHLAGSGWRLELLDLNTTRASQQAWTAGESRRHSGEPPSS